MSGGVCDSRRAPCAGNAARATLNSEVLLVYLRVRVKFVPIFRNLKCFSQVSFRVFHPSRLANAARSDADEPTSLSDELARARASSAGGRAVRRANGQRGGALARLAPGQRHLWLRAVGRA